MQGILLALIPMFAWGSIGLVANKFGGDAKQQTLGMICPLSSRQVKYLKKCLFLMVSRTK